MTRVGCRCRLKIRTRSVLAVPIVSEQTLLGVLVLTHAQPAHFTADHERLMEAAADQMALAIRNARSFEMQRRMADRQTTLYEVLRSVSGQLNADVIAQTAVAAIAHFAGWPHVALLLADADGRHWMVRAVSGEPSLPLGICFAHRARDHARRRVHGTARSEQTRSRSG